MQHIYKIRLFFSACLIIAMFLPLSSCELRSTDEATKTTEFQTIERYLVPENAPPIYYLWILAFLAPGLWCFISRQVKNQALVKSLHLFMPIPPLILVSQHYLSGTLMFGGYLTAISCLGLLYISAREITIKWSRPH